MYGSAPTGEGEARQALAALAAAERCGAAMLAEVVRETASSAVHDAVTGVTGVTMYQQRAEVMAQVSWMWAPRYVLYSTRTRCFLHHSLPQLSRRAFACSTLSLASAFLPRSLLIPQLVHASSHLNPSPTLTLVLIITFTLTLTLTLTLSTVSHLSHLATDGPTLINRPQVAREAERTPMRSAMVGLSRTPKKTKASETSAVTEPTMQRPSPPPPLTLSPTTHMPRQGQADHARHVTWCRLPRKKTTFTAR